MCTATRSKEGRRLEAAYGGSLQACSMHKRHVSLLSRPGAKTDRVRTYVIDQR